LLAYVLHQYDWSETSLIVELFTRAQGRVVVAAKGAKRPTSNFRAVLLPFQPLLALLGKHAGRRTRRGAQPAQRRMGRRPAAAGSASAVQRLLPQRTAAQAAGPAGPAPGLFDAYADTLAALAGGEDEPVALRAFELQCCCASWACCPTWTEPR
jgi:DNA repair protein RecO (recombination protein O)